MIAEKLEQGKNAKALAQTLIRALLPFKEHVYTITSDNGTEFAEHKQAARRLDADFYFAHPYCSWQRGLNEYTNKLIREYIPKKTSFDDFNSREIKQIQYEINKRPRKLFNYETPKRIFFASL